MESHSNNTPQKPAPRRISEQNDFTQVVHEALDGAFGVGFDLWAPGEPGSEPPRARPEGFPAKLLDAVSQLFREPTISRSKPCLVEPSGDRCWLAIPLARDGRVVWRHVDSAKLTMRSYSPQFVDDYLAHAGEAALASVGGYQLEGPGVQLFSHIAGDYFTILGLPLLPLLDYLRRGGVLRT